MKNKALIVAFMMLFSASCIVQSPKYSTLEQVMALHLGISKKQVEETLGIKPYNIKAYTDTSIVFIYIGLLTAKRFLSIQSQLMVKKQ